jgi:hypothetical protein
MKPGDLAQLVPALDSAGASKHACPLPLGHPERTVRIVRGQTLVVIEVQALPKFSVERTALGNDVVVLAGDQLVHIREGLIRVVGEGE